MVTSSKCTGQGWWSCDSGKHNRFSVHTITDLLDRFGSYTCKYESYTCVYVYTIVCLPTAALPSTNLYALVASSRLHLLAYNWWNHVHLWTDSPICPKLDMNIWIHITHFPMMSCHMLIYMFCVNTTIANSSCYCTRTHHYHSCMLMDIRVLSWHLSLFYWIQGHNSSHTWNYSDYQHTECQHT